MAKNTDKTEEIVVPVVDMGASEVKSNPVCFRCAYRNLIISGTRIAFRNGIYVTDVEEEIELLRKHNLVQEVGV